VSRPARAAVVGPPGRYRVRAWCFPRLCAGPVPRGAVRRDQVHHSRSAGSRAWSPCGPWGDRGQFASTPAALALSVSAFIIFLGTRLPSGTRVMSGCAQPILPVLGENVLKTAAGLRWSTVYRLGDTGRWRGSASAGCCCWSGWPSGAAPRPPFLGCPRWPAGTWSATAPWAAPRCRALGSLFAADRLCVRRRAAGKPRPRGALHVSSALSPGTAVRAGSVLAAFSRAARSAAAGLSRPRGAHVARVSLPLATILRPPRRRCWLRCSPRLTAAMATCSSSRLCRPGGGGINRLATFSAVVDYAARGGCSPGWRATWRRWRPDGRRRDHRAGRRLGAGTTAAARAAALTVPPAARPSARLSSR